MTYEIGKYYEFGLTKMKGKFLGDVITYENDYEFVEVTEYSDFPEWCEFKIDEPVIVSNNGTAWARWHFAGLRNGEPTAWMLGTKWASKGARDVYKFCRRPTPEELGDWRSK